MARLLRFGTTEAPRLTKENLNSASVATFITYIQNLIRNNAFDDSVMQMLIDRASIRLLGYYFPSSETARRNPIENHWTTDWDAATIIQALEEFYPVRPEDRHLATSSRWQQVVVESRKKARIQTQDMEAARRDTINEWSSAEERIGPIPYLNNYEILKDLSRCFTSKDNPAGTSKSNVQFQRDLTTMIQGDREYYTSPTLSRLCEMVARIMYQWEAMTAEVNRMGGQLPSGASSNTSRTKTPKASDEAATSAAGASAATTRKCQGCNRAHHTRDVCRLRFHPDFNKSGSWVGSAAERAIRVWDSSTEVALPWEKRADGTAWEGQAEPRATTGSSAPHGTSEATSPPKKKDKPKESKDYYGRGGGDNNNDRRGNDGEDVGVGVTEESTLTTGTKVCFVVPMLSPTCHATAGSPTPTAPTVSVWSHHPTLQLFSLLSHCLTLVHTHHLSTEK